MAERNSLLNCRTGNGTEGSNPSSSANKNRKACNQLITGFSVLQELPTYVSNYNTLLSNPGVNRPIEMVQLEAESGEYPNAIF